MLLYYIIFSKIYVSCIDRYRREFSVTSCINLMMSQQVGGHTRLLVLNDSTVIKPLNIRELHFYQNIPEDIQSFVPRYKGEHRIFFSKLEIKRLLGTLFFMFSLNASLSFIALNIYFLISILSLCIYLMFSFFFNLVYK